MAKRSRLRSGFTLGGEQAEADPLLDDAFYESSDFEVIRSRHDSRCFIVGRTGSGKSAALQRLAEVETDHVIRINPEDLSLPYITDLQVIRYLDSLNVSLDLFWIALWKHVLLIEVIKHRYKVNSPAAKQTLMANLREKFKKDPAKQSALDYLEEFEGKFWAGTEERVREITSILTNKISNELSGNVGASAAGVSAGGKFGTASGSESTMQSRGEQAERFQRIVNDSQLSKLNKMLSILDEEILDQQHFTYVVVDDLDRDWVDERIANDLIRCLFRTVLDMKRVKQLKVLVALRTNIFQELDFGSKSGGQEEKFRSLVLQLRWTQSDLEELLDERVAIAAPRVGLDVQTVSELLPNSNKTRGNPLKYILDRTLLRPRDAIAFANECLSLGIGKTRLSWDDIHTAETAYSAKRLLALRDEWKTTYPGIDKVLGLFRGVPGVLSRPAFERKLDEAMLLLSDTSFSGALWLTRLSEPMWTSNDNSSWYEIYSPLASLLFSIGFIGASARAHAAPVFYQDNSLYADSESNFDKDAHFFVHRTYQASLDIRPSR
jgi:hypothetical protein